MLTELSPTDLEDTKRKEQLEQEKRTVSGVMVVGLTQTVECK